MRIFTVGYEACDITEFCERLRSHGIELIADLRKNPVSRKKGFSKRKLAENLQDFKIEYLHFGGLGVPTEWRKQAKEEIITRKKMFQDYVRKVIPAHKIEIEQIRKLMKRQKIALLCYEADASDCHRSFVAQKLLQLEKTLKIKNLSVKETAQLKATPKLFR